MKKGIYITTPLYYVNADPHIGHAYTQVAADVLARYYRSCQKEVFFLTGTDEYGQKVQDAAAKKGMSPKEHIDGMVGKFKDLWVKLNISNDGFIRTTDKDHKERVQNILRTLYKKGDIQKRSYSGWYCVSDERFWKEKDLKDGCCPDCGRDVQKIEEDNYFFLMSKYQDELIKYIEQTPGYIMPEIRRNEVLGFLNNNKLDDLCISRPKSRLSWGISLPFDDGYVTYVWFDALINYYSATGYIAPQEIKWWPANFHLIGKDILTTHSVYWSTMLMALELPLPKTIFAHGWWTITGEKMSKSFGNVVNPLELIEKWNVDSFRYFLLRQVTFGLDGNFSEEQFKSRYDSDLANELGNLLKRVLSMINKYSPEYLTKEPDGFDRKINKLYGELDGLYGELKFNIILQKIWDIVKAANIYIEQQKPWELNKNGEEKRLAEVLTNLFEVLRNISQMLEPFMPETCKKIKKQLGVIRAPKDINFKWSPTDNFKNIRDGLPLFPKQ